jgi:pyruvate/2-oxoacid:ferredoxin oxidoreductase beta subunit
MLNWRSVDSRGGRKTSRKKNLTEITAAHELPSVATASVGHLSDLIAKVTKAKALRGERVHRGQLSGMRRRARV